jgi:hypothetical protein
MTEGCGKHLADRSVPGACPRVRRASWGACRHVGGCHATRSRAEPPIDRPSLQLGRRADCEAGCDIPRRCRATGSSRTSRSRSCSLRCVSSAFTSIASRDACSDRCCFLAGDHVAGPAEAGSGVSPRRVDLFRHWTAIRSYRFVRMVDGIGDGRDLNRVTFVLPRLAPNHPSSGVLQDSNHRPRPSGECHTRPTRARSCCLDTSHQRHRASGRDG